jgi:hypothetical protein
MMFRHDTYMAFWEDIARRHIEIQHTLSDKHFAEVIISSNPLPTSYLHDFTNNLKSKIKWNRKLMIVESYENDFGEKRDDNPKKWFIGAFLILDEAKKDDIAEQRVKFTECEQVAEEIINEVDEWFLADARRGVFDLSDVQMEKVGPIAGTMVGVRVDFKFWQPVGDVFVHDPLKWIE